MTLIDWLRESHKQLSDDGIRGARESLYELHLGGLRRIGQLYNYGDSIYDREWDVLIVLDACRSNLFAEVADKYEFISNPESVISNASSSEEWMRKNFSARPTKASETIYVTGNPFSGQCLDAEDFHLLDEVWRYSWSSEASTILPEPVTDRAIHHRRQNPNRKMAIHYMQPHYPFVPSDLSYSLNVDSFGDGRGRSVWDDLRRGRISREAVWKGYRANLEYVLDSVRTILNNIDADRVAITADHGNALGEFGIYGHPAYVPLNAIKCVPWTVTSASDSGEYTPHIKRTDKNTDESVKSRLEDLGYV